MTSPPLPPIPCPLCDDCSHDIRAQLLELADTIKNSVNEATELVLDGLEGTNVEDTAAAFTASILGLQRVKLMTQELNECVPLMMQLKIKQQQAKR